MQHSNDIVIAACRASWRPSTRTYLTCLPRCCVPSLCCRIAQPIGSAAPPNLDVSCSRLPADQMRLAAARGSRRRAAEANPPATQLLPYLTWSFTGAGGCEPSDTADPRGRGSQSADRRALVVAAPGSSVEWQLELHCFLVVLVRRKFFCERWGSRQSWRVLEMKTEVI